MQELCMQEPAVVHKGWPFTNLMKFIDAFIMFIIHLDNAIEKIKKLITQVQSIANSNYYWAGEITATGNGIQSF